MHHIQNSLEKRQNFYKKTKTLDMKIQKQISPPLINNRKTRMQEFPAKAKDEKKIAQEGI